MPVFTQVCSPASHSHPGDPTLTLPPSPSPSSPQGLRGTLRQCIFIAFCPWGSLLRSTRQPSKTNCALHSPKSFALPFQGGSSLEALGNSSLDILLPMFHPALTQHLLPLVTQPGLVHKTQSGIKHQSSTAKGWPLPQAAHSLGSLAPTMVKQQK